MDLGPEGGQRGGRVIAEGTPEQVAETPGSATGEYLARVLRGEPLVPLSDVTFADEAGRPGVGGNGREAVGRRTSRRRASASPRRGPRGSGSQRGHASAGGRHPLGWPHAGDRLRLPRRRGRDPAGPEVPRARRRDHADRRPDVPAAPPARGAGRRPAGDRARRPSASTSCGSSCSTRTAHEVTGATGSLMARGHPDGRDAILTFSIDLWNLTFPTPGDYSFRILVNGSERKRLALVLVRPAESGATRGLAVGPVTPGATRAGRARSRGPPATSSPSSTRRRSSPRAPPTGCWPPRATAGRRAGSPTSSRCPDRLRDDDIADLRRTALRVRAAYGPKDSLRDVLPGVGHGAAPRRRRPPAEGAREARDAAASGRLSGAGRTCLARSATRRRGIAILYRSTYRPSRKTAWRATPSSTNPSALVEPVRPR